MAFLFRRLLLVIPVAFVVYTLVFVFVRIVPGDTVDAILLDASSRSPEVEQRLRSQLRLDKPIWQQYLLAGKDALGGNLGKSFHDGRPVTEEIWRRAPITLELAALAMVVGVTIALPVGVLSAVKKDTLLDQGVRLLSVVALATPGFWIGTLVVVFPAIWWGYSPPLVYAGAIDSPATNLRQLLPPALVLGATGAGIMARFVRSAMLEVLRQDYVRTARSKGLAESRVIYVHAMRNALGPTVTVMGLIFANLMSGSIIMETIFNIPGLGQLTLGSISQRDYPQIQAVVLVFAVVVVGVNSVIDLALAALDPRVRLA